MCTGINLNSVDISIKELPCAGISKKRQADDVLTIMSDHCYVTFCQLDDTEETLQGCWCNKCK